MRRTVRISYRFTYQGESYRAVKAPVGDTVEENLIEQEWKTSAIFDALGDDYDAEWVENILGTLVPNDEQLSEAGFNFEYFYLED